MDRKAGYCARVSFENINGDLKKHQISQAYGGVTLVSDFQLSPRLSAYGEGGLGVTSRSGFVINGLVAVFCIYRVIWALYVGMTFGWFFGPMVTSMLLWGVIGAVAGVAAVGFLTRYNRGS